MAPDDPRTQLQHEVQRLIGRCLLRLQQYERLLKTLLTHHEVRGTVSELPALLADRREMFAVMTLGQLAKALFDSVVVVEGAGPARRDDAALPSDRVSLGFRFQIEMTPERRDQVKVAIAELVRLRNDLVHHLIDRFDIWTDDGCVAAADHLRQTYERIDGHFHELRWWAEHMGEASLAMATFAQNGAFEDLVLNGIAPDGAVDWPRAGIVRALRDALKAGSDDGWSRLPDARAWMERHHPEQVPERYGCRTWPQVLSESRAFRIEYRVEAARRVAWFSERPVTASR